MQRLISQKPEGKISAATTTSKNVNVSCTLHSDSRQVERESSDVVNALDVFQKSVTCANFVWTKKGMEGEV